MTQQNENRVKLEFFSKYFDSIITAINDNRSWSKDRIMSARPSLRNGDTSDYKYYLNRLFEVVTSEIYDTFYKSTGKSLSQGLRSTETLINQEAKFVQSYVNCVGKLQSGDWEMPECVLEMYFTKPEAWKELPHRSITESDKLAFYRTEEDYLRDRATKTKPARYFVSKAWGIESQALEFNNQWVSTGQKIPKMFYLSDLEGGCSEENWKWVYGNTDTATNSCMIKCSDAARVYAYDSNLDLVYFTDDDTPKGKVTTRTIIRKDNDTYIRIYYTDYRQEKIMDILLKGKNYSCERDMDGIKLGMIPRHESGAKSYWMPYVDGHSQCVIQENDYFLVANYDDADDSGKDFYEVDEPQGYLYIMSKCKCGRKSRDFHLFVTVENNQETTIEVCGFCVRNQVWNDDTERYYDNRYFGNYMIFDKYDTESHMIRKDIPVQLSGLVKITDPHLISHYTGTSYNEAGLYCRKGDEVTLYDGSIGTVHRLWKPTLDAKGVEIVGQEVWDNLKISSADYRIRDKLSANYWDGAVSNRNKVIQVLSEIGIIPKDAQSLAYYEPKNMNYFDKQITRTSDNGVITYHIEDIQKEVNDSNRNMKLTLESAGDWLNTANFIYRAPVTRDTTGVRADANVVRVRTTNQGYSVYHDDLSNDITNS